MQKLINVTNFEHTKSSRDHFHTFLTANSPT